MARYHLHARSIVRAAGDDAHRLLNDTLTCRFDDELPGRGRWFALLSPQGKVQAEGLVTEADGAFWFDLDAAVVADFIKRMKLYRLRAKVDIEHDPSLAVIWSPDVDGPARAIIAYRDERAPTLGTRYLVRHEDIEAPASPEAEPNEAYYTAKIAAGVAEFGADFGVNEMFAHDIGLDLLGGIDFKKGCFIGQEVVSRMQHRGTARRRPVVVDGIPDGAAAGAPLLVGEREAGTIGTPVEGKAVAIVRLDRIEEGIPPTVGGLPVNLTLPEWATYKFGEVIAEA
ncbi:MAG TPA: folate-binding protein [Devosiaceae bacterium]|nr:folate-binding protein [Devosiaceae bacterium]